MTDHETNATEDTQHPAEAAPDISPEAQNAQEVPTESAGQRLTRESHDAQQPRWKRWLGRG